ncbi:MAG TPA: hypothetical protein VK922_05160 [Gemmatimonadaceae bacterium]|nr:hypothetical protein [Gemmatimonadaceae bacterium]
MPAKKATKKRAAKKSTAKRATKKRTTKKTAAKKASRRVGKSKIPGISRIDQESTRTHGWFVRVGYRRTKQGWRPKHRAFFGDKSHGGKTAALKAAEQWLNSVKE